MTTILRFLLCLLATNLFAGQVTLSWDALPDTNLVGYQVWSGPASRQYDHVLMLGKVTSATVTNLPSGHNFFALTAYDRDHIDSAKSNEVEAIVPMDAPVLHGKDVVEVSVPVYSLGMSLAGPTGLAHPGKLGEPTTNLSVVFPRDKQSEFWGVGKPTIRTYKTP